MNSHTPSPHLFTPVSRRLKPMVDSSPYSSRAADISNEISQLFSHRDYPCVGAIRAFHSDEFRVGIYGEFGTGQNWRDLRNDLEYFVEEQKRSGSIYLSFWAVFDDADLSEVSFEKLMWRELSCLTSEEDRKTDWLPTSPSNPEDPLFRFSLNGSEFFVVGLHSNSSRRSRHFRAPAMVFNLFNQFEQLEEAGQYQPMVKVNRARDIKYQGDVNPMALAHGEKWESIQFSGKKNDSKWKCPFHFLKRAEKP